MRKVNTFTKLQNEKLQCLCIIDHPSQQQYPCLVTKTDERSCLYFYRAVDLVCEATVAEHFVNLQDITQQKVVFLFQEKKTCFKNVFLETRNFELGRIARKNF